MLLVTTLGANCYVIITFNFMPHDLKLIFKTRYNMNDDFIKVNLYKQPNPNAYLATFAEFLILNKESTYVQSCH
jgi:hypothetical protein